MTTSNRNTLLLGALLAAFAASSGPAQAMTSGTPADGTAHPAAVALMLSDGYWARPFCSGMLLSGKVVATASHCMAYALSLQRGGWQIMVTNDPTLQQDARGWLLVGDLATQRVVSQIVLNPAYNPKLLGGYAHDVSAAVLAAPIALDASALPTLPPIGVLDQLRASKYLRHASFTVLGYGTQEKALPGNTTPSHPFSGERRAGTLGYDALDKNFIHQSQVIAQGEDGACNGDSGGPSLLHLGETDYLVGVTSSGDNPCVATNTATRTDTAEGLNLLTAVMGANPDDGE